MTDLPIAYYLVTIAGLVPLVAAYFSGKYYFAFEKLSARQLILIALSLLAIFGTILLQGQILHAYGISTRDEYLRRLTPFQFFVALVVFFWKLLSTRKRLSASEKEDAEVTH